MENVVIYVFDLDNTLCFTSKKQNGDWDYGNSKPYFERIKKVNDLYDQGNYIIIETARGNSSKIDWYLFTFEQLTSWDLKFHEVRTGIKFGADYYIDDRGINSEDFFRDINEE